MNQTDGYNQSSYSSNHWPDTGLQAQDYHSGSSSQEISSAVTALTEPFTTVPTTSNGKRLFSPKLRTLEYLPITNSPPRLLGGNTERTIYRHVLSRKC